MQITSILRSLGFVSVSASLAACGGSEGDTKSDLAGVAGGSPGGTGSVSNPGSTGGEGSVLTLGTGSVSIDNLAHEMAIITCNLVSRCDAGSGVLGTGFPQQCVSNLEKVFADQSIASLKQAIASGKSIYDGSKVRACFDLYPELACDYSNEKVLYSACANIWGGSVAPGGACNYLRGTCELRRGVARAIPVHEPS